MLVVAIGLEKVLENGTSKNLALKIMHIYIFCIAFYRCYCEENLAFWGQFGKTFYGRKHYNLFLPSLMMSKMVVAAVVVLMLMVVVVVLLLMVMVVVVLLLISMPMQALYTVAFLLFCDYKIVHFTVFLFIIVLSLCSF